MKPVFALLVASFALAACGVDGEPQQPSVPSGEQGVPVTGSATVGMAVGSSGARGYGGVAVSNGPISLFLGF